MSKPRAMRTVALVAAIVIACNPSSASAPSSSLASGSAPPQGGQVAALDDVLTYKGGMTRTGVTQGPGPAGNPVLLWEAEIPGGVAAQPLVHDGAVIVAGQDGTLRGLDGATGREAWTVALGAGVVSTPTIAESTLYAITEDGVMRTLSLADRQLGWTAPGFVSESIVTVVGDVVLAGGDGEVIAVAAADGRELWRAATGGTDRAAVEDRVAYVGGDGSGRLTAIALDGGTERWQIETGAARVLTPAIANGNLVVAARDIPSGRNIVLGLGEDGTEQWRWETPERDRIGGHVVAGDRVFVSISNPEGAMYGLDRGTGRELWKRPLAGELVAVPVAAADTIYVGGTSEGIVAIDGASGAVRWAWALGPILGAGIAVTGGLVLVTTRDGDGDGRVLALAGEADPRIAGVPSFQPSSSPMVPATPSLPIRTLSVDSIEGRTLLLSTAVSPDGTMYVADMANSEILVRGADGVIESWGKKGSGPGEFDFSEVTQNDSSTGIAVSPDGELVAVGDGANHRVQLFDASRRLLRPIGRLGREDGQFVNPCCVAVDVEHRIWVVDAARHDVQLFDRDGRHLRSFGGPGRENGSLSRPSWPFFDSVARELYVPDFGNRRVAVFAEDGSWLRNYDRSINGALLLDEVNAVAVDASGRIYILDATSRLFVIDQDGTLLALLAASLPDVGSVEYASFALGTDGRLYLADIGGGTQARLVIAQLEPPFWPPR